MRTRELRASLTVSATLEAGPGREENLSGGFRALAAPTKAEQDYLVYEPRRSQKKPGLFLF